MASLVAQMVRKEREVAQSCLTLCNPMDCSLPGFSVHGIFQATVLEWGAISFSICPRDTCRYSEEALGERDRLKRCYKGHIDKAQSPGHTAGGREAACGTTGVTDGLR